MPKLSTGANQLGLMALLCLCATAIAGCDADEPDTVAKPVARPVSYVNLELSDPSAQSLVAGSVESWKKELVGFRVSGRVRFVREPGIAIKGRLLDEAANVLEPGTKMGSIENERYRLRVEEAQARVQSVQAEALSVQTEIQQTIPNELKEVQAEYDRSKMELGRQLTLLKKRVGTQKRVDDARAQFKVAEARLGQLRSKQAEKKAQLTAIEARVLASKEGLRRAEIDLADTELYSPFNGQISKVHVIPGGFVEKGQPVVTVQMMDPIKVQVAVSPEVDRAVNFNDLMKVYVDGAKDPLNGWVWNKDTVADASTRTFLITLLVRNRQVDVDFPAELEGQKFYRTSGLWNLESEHDNGRGPYFINGVAVHEDDVGPFVWKAEGLRIADLQRDFDPVFRVKKVRIKLGNRRLRYLQVFTYHELKDLGGLDPQSDLMPQSLPEDVKDGDIVFLSRKRWLLRPGQLVNVDLRHGRRPEGFYVPARSVIKSGAGHHVFVVSKQGNGEQQSTLIKVRLGPTFSAYQVIEPVADGALSQGMKLIVDGAHYLRDGDPVNAFNELELGL